MIQSCKSFSTCTQNTHMLLTDTNFVSYIQVKAMKTGSNWRTDVTMKESNSSVQVKMWNDRVTEITEEHQGALVT